MKKKKVTPNKYDKKYEAVKKILELKNQVFVQEIVFRISAGISTMFMEKTSKEVAILTKMMKELDKLENK